MNKETLSSYGWIIVVVLILAVMFLVAPLFGNTIKGAVKDIINDFKDKGNSAMSQDLLSLGTLGNGNSSGADDMAATTDYTVEEIAADPNVYAVGSTKASNVVAVLSEDKTRIDYYKNESDADTKSDGVMEKAAFYYQGSFNHCGNGYANLGTDIPYKNKDTLTEAYVHDGIKNVALGTFADCKKLETVKLSDNIEIIDAFAFRNDNKMDLDLPESLKTIGNNAFQRTALTDGNIPDSVSTMGEWSLSQTNIEKLYLPENLTEVPRSLMCYNTKIKEVYIPKSVKTIELEAFTCYNAGVDSQLEKVEFEEGSKLTDIRIRAFSTCKKLKSIELPNSVKRVYNDAFCNCGFTELKLPSSLSLAENGAFLIPSLKYVYVPNTVSGIQSQAVGPSSKVYCQGGETPTGSDANWAHGCNIVYNSSYSDFVNRV